MPLNIRSLIVAAGLGGLVFLWLYRAKVLPVRGREIRRWGLAWLFVTCAGFLLPNYWLFILVVGLVCIVASSPIPDRKVALYFLLLPVMPMMPMQVPAFGLVNYLFDMNYARLLSLALLLPAILSVMTAGAKTRRIQSLPTDKYIAVYCLVVFALSFRSTTLTDAFRILFNLSVDVALPYLAVTRSVAGKEGFVRVFAAIAASGAVMSMIGIFEAGKKWLLFQGLTAWSGRGGIVAGYDLRAGFLRAATTFSSPIIFGFYQMICLGSLLAVKTRAKFSTKHLALAGMFSLALLMSFSRGPWVATAAMVLIYAYLGRNSLALPGAVIGRRRPRPRRAVADVGRPADSGLPALHRHRAGRHDRVSSAIAHQWPRCFLADAIFRVVDL